ncbi:monosaccharide ABC transporter substrate-binding protein (CUT2 family) [Haloactinopolyspora alba]|uniref:Monosaccharide ABC transporter substrate-binding protein (CUT2 family) n=1 Tax=Haloactinopolyspora alba TaxID=648780 RepID=A0A2P8EFH3_9ACTN|nr:sugar ABC transporter substrate-binding protein [Haloactinopolyspora alba]PSL08227.1 monosaccharide ABC transporter substrate-binding protein (CUT2 family) [Haloactinopolyspora alba]
MRHHNGVRAATLAGAAMMVLAACATEEPSASSQAGGDETSDSCRIAIDNGSGTGFPYPNAGAKGIIDRAEEIGCEVIAHLDGKSNVQTEAANVQNIISQQPDGVIIIPANAAEAGEFVDQMTEAGIKVVAYHSIIGADRGLKDVYPSLSALVIENETGVGEQVGKKMMEQIPEGGPIGLVLGAPGYAENQLRVEKFREVTEGTFEIVSEQPGAWTADGGRAACASMLSANPDLVGFYSISDDMGVGCQQAVEAAESDAIVWGVGGSKLGIKSIENGGMDGTVCYKPYDGGKIAMDELKKVLDDPDYGNGELVFYDTPVITAENVDECEPQW